MHTRLFFLMILLGLGTACQYESAAESSRVQNDSTVAKSGIIYHSSDGGNTWEDISGDLSDSLNPNSLNALNGTIWLGAADGLYQGTKYISEVVWTKMPVDVREVVGVYDGANGKYLVSHWHGVYQELPGADLWAPLHQKLPDQLVNVLFETPNGTILLGCESGIYRSEDHGNNWKQVCKGTQLRNFTISDGIIIAGSIAGIFRSADDGKSWERTLYGDLEARQIRVTGSGLLGLLEQDPAVKGVRNTGLYLSADNGLTWLPFGTPPPGAIYDMDIMGNYIYVVASTGMFRSDDMGAHWKPVNPATTKSDIFTNLISTGSDLYLLVSNNGGC